MSANPFLVKMLNTLIVPETDVRKIVLRLPHHVDIALEGHEYIYQAIKAGDPQTARHTMIDALEQPFKAIDKYMQAGDQVS